MNYTFNFDANSTGWTGNFSRFTGTTACGGAGGAMRRNLYSGAATGQLISPLTGTSLGGQVTIGYTYKAAVWSANTTAAPVPWGSFDVQYGATATGPWTTFATITNEAQLGNPCISKSHTFNPPAGALFIRWSATWQGGDYYLNFDNITLAETVTPCAGTPAPGNTTASVASACPGANFIVGIQTPASGTGVTYTWEFDNGGGWTAFGTSAPTQTVNQSLATSYRCTVTCTEPGGGSATSTPISVPMAAPFPVDFAPTTFPSNCWTATAAATLLRSTVNAFGAPGQGAAQWNFYSASTNTILTITSPTFTAIGAGQQIRFDVAGTTYTGGEIDSITVEISTNGGTSWAVLQGMSNNTGGLLNTVPPQTGNFVPTAAQWNTLAFPLPAGVNMVRFRGRSAFGNSVYIDNIAIEPVPTCLPATSVAATGLSGSSAIVTWSGTGTFIVEYGPAATFTTPGTGTAQGPEATSTVVTGITGNSYTIPNGLTHPTQYRVFVRKDCTASNDGYSANSQGVLFYTRPPYDECQAITSIPTVAPGGTILLTGNNFGATDTEGFGALVSWEAFTLTSCATTLNIDYCGSTPARTNAFVNLFVGCPQSAGFIAWTGSVGPTCPNGSVNIPYANIPAGTYYIAVMNQTGASGPYGINVTVGPACPPPPPNDVCGLATPISCGQTLSGTTVDATTTGAPATLCNGFLNNSSGGVWYVANGLCGSVTASLCSTVTAWDSKLAVYSGSCGSLVCVTTNDDFCGGLSQVTWAADASETYYLYVLGFGAANSGAFSLALNCTSTPVAATATATDDCANNQFSVAVNITDLGGAASATVDYSVNGAAQPPVTGAGLGVTPLGPFPATAEVSVSVSNGTTGCTADLGSYYSNCPVTITCGSTLTVNHCYTNNDTRTWTFTSPALGETVTVTFIAGTMAPGDVIRAYSGTDDTGDPIVGLTGSFASLAGVSGSSTGQSIFIEIDSDGSGSCADGQASSWQFEVECTAGCTDPDGIVTPNVNCATYSFTLDVEVLGTGDAATTDLVYTVNGGSPITIPGLDFNSGIQTIGPWPIGTTINVVLAHETDGACDKNLGNFQPGLACPPPGSSCALPFVVNSFPFTQTNTTCGKGNNVMGTQCGLAANYGGGEDFVYQLNIANAGDYQISLQLTGGASFAGWFLKSGTNCNNAGQCLANAVTTVANGTASAIVTLAAGTYYVIEDSRPLPNCVGYNISITPFAFLPGDNCSNAIPLTVGATCVPTAGSVAGMTQTIVAGVCGGTADDDVWYSFVATTPNQDVILDADFDAVLEVRSGACTGATFWRPMSPPTVSAPAAAVRYLTLSWSWS
ncbi:MAG TPA: hypothetical protein PLN54_05205 [Flavobacteriales bacterium]|nr:hypothetical protein [Flavobacteriales bacterium]